MPINSPTGFLDITNATLRTSNLEAENLLITGGNIYVTSELEADATVLNLENVTRKGNVSSNTIEITNATTGIVATGNVHALKFIGSGSHLTGIPPTAITGTLSQWSDGANSDVYIASNVGIGNVHTLTSNTLQVGGNLYVRDTDANVLTVNGNVVASYFEGDGSRLSGIVTDLQGVTDNGNVTTNVVQFSNATTGLVTTANIEVGGDIKVVGLSAGTVPYVASDKFLKDSFITMTGDATVITSNLDVTGNIFMRGNKFIVESETKLINDAIIGIANNNTVSTTDKGIIMQNTTGNVAIIHHGTGDGFADQLTFGYTADPLDTVTVTNDLTKELTVNVLGNVITQNNLSIGGLLKINTISAASSHSLQAVTNLGNVTSNTVQFSNAITSLVASSNIVATGNVSAGRNTDTTSYFGRAAVGYMGTSDQASFAHFDRNSSAQYALKQTAAGPTYINTPASGHIRFTVNDGNAGAEKMRITSAGKVGIGVSAPHANLHVEGNVYVSSNLTVGGDLDISGNLGSSLVNLIYPIGAVYISVNSADPGTIWSGTTWVAFGAGRTLVGIDSGDGDFDSVEETGGAKTHTLTRSQIPPHQHNIQEFPGYSENASQWLSFISGNYAGLPFRRGGANANYRRPSGDGTDIPNPIGNGSGAATSHNIMQPYIVTYMWKRTA
jgi:microcystin-dependent protein